jgi:hypothetical protein
MSLQPNEITALTLQLSSGRYFDYECCDFVDTVGNKLLTGARGIVEGGAQMAQLAVNTWNDSATFLIERANQLSSLKSTSSHAYFSDMLDGAGTFIRSTAINIGSGDNSDGPAMPLGSYNSDRWGLLGLASIIEARVRGLYLAEGGVPVNVNIDIIYITSITDDNGDFAPFCISGSANNRRLPRVVNLILKEGTITSRDLWHIAYTLHHELVCHSFQGARSTARLENAHPTCHWSEGWMDTLAFDLVEDWTGAPLSWLPLRGENARGEVRRFHEERYVKSLKGDDRKRRQRARDAYRKLAEILLSNGLCTEAEAQERVRRFSLIANAHPEAPHLEAPNPAAPDAPRMTRLKALSTRLMGLLLTRVRLKAQLSAARACLAFTESQDFAMLEQEIQAAELI